MNLRETLHKFVQRIRSEAGIAGPVLVLGGLTISIPTLLWAAVVR